MIAIKKDIYICFIDCQKTFDRVLHQKIMEFLNYTEMDKKDLRIIQNLYWEQKAVVRLQNGNSDAFNIERGVRKGCVLSPKQFNLYTEPIFRLLEELPGFLVFFWGGGGGGAHKYLSIHRRHRLQTVKKKLQKFVNKVKEQSENLGLYMNVSETKTMMVNKWGKRGI